MPTTFMQMVDDAMRSVPAISPDELQQQLNEDHDTLVIDVRDESSIRASGSVPGAAAISAGSLLYKADQEVPEAWRDARLADRDRPIVTHCDLGPLSAIAAKNLQDMGFTNVRYLAGGIQAWTESGRPVEQAPPDSE
jgi:sulfur-carrier protein adenylyltransferase/sulfurtransferase